MRILLVAATDFEIKPFAEKLGKVTKIYPRVKAYTHRREEIHLLTAGVGMVATAAWCSRMLTQNRYDLAVNLGVCGSFDPAIRLTQVVHVTSDCISELGVEDGDDFLTLHDLKLLDENEFPFKDGMLENHSPPHSVTLAGLQRVDGITVNTVHGNERSIAAVIDRFQPQVESMEGAGFMYACLINTVPFAQVRAVSNLVEKRNREAWDLKGAICKLSDVALRIIDEV